MQRIIQIKGTNAEKFYCKSGHAILICINDIAEILIYVKDANNDK